LPNLVFAVRFSYVNEGGPLMRHSPIRHTVCRIEPVEPEAIKGIANTDPDRYKCMGVARCHGRDVYKRETERKIALGRALAQFSSDRPTRRLVWNCYHIMSNKRDRAGCDLAKVYDALRALRATNTRLPPGCCYPVGL
jgi:hypothetical protein